MKPGAQTIWKFPLRITDVQTLEIPGLIQILDVQRPLVSESNDETLWLWALCMPDQPASVVHIGIAGTGNLFELPWSYPPNDRAELPGLSRMPVPPRHLATVQMGTFVWHVFVIGKWTVKP